MAAEGQVIYLSNHKICGCEVSKGAKNFRNNCSMKNKDACCIACPDKEQCFFECSHSLTNRMYGIECDKWKVVK